ncbi:MAG: tRNA (adenosine(37)-N6)-dimethylallyltransferase MiaA [Omnitrophica bacterium RIFCSPHIGHO2_02_FULL_46_11]|nr:MAG: tRNA (adenosine(37)-N6)-dimethylallyltransferase MiaA [Omnitrophica bacterium RIFCSPLOWO2_01_FULL_45_10b]OGW87241.1 MAG: tRNA (adenosine(37)-N6)-dimethylallyltransferase MiaA [Omnitrophica bacterium RIFCSPHIGHO2_02_FULL_46_11]
MSKYVLFLVGPTASGKSKIALPLAKKLKGEIISCDSMQIYSGMDIGTAKPIQSERKMVPHYLIDLLSPKTECSVFKYRRLALKAIGKIHIKGRLPIVVGGSGLYFKAIVDGLAPLPGKQRNIRGNLESLVKLKGLPALYQKLEKADPKRAHKINPNDKRRIIRALEILETSNRSQSDWEHETQGLEKQGIEPIIFGLLRNREELYRRIEARVDQMFKEGWIKEVKKLKRVGLSRTAKAAIGYQEILHYLAGQMTLQDAEVTIKKRTRHLAKKQMTWFRRDPRVHWLEVNGRSSVTSTVQTIIKKLKDFGCPVSAS